VSSAILVLSLVTNYAFLLWLPVLAFAAYKGWAFAKPWCVVAVDVLLLKSLNQ
jgi:hypothetical protein